MNELRAAIDHIRSELVHARTQGPLDPFMEDVESLLYAYDELNHAICWDTSCLNCASLLDKNYEQYVKLDEIRAVLEGEE